jgi:ABC-type polysaccharide/polyol phosphate transport system ATPase subunit
VSGSVVLHDAGKRFVKYDDVPTFVSRALHLGHRSRRSSLWALRHVELTVQPGERVGLIGLNGSGKTTLLSLLAGVTQPTEGTVRVTGRLAPLLAVGVGFHQELTGRENIVVNGRLLGLSDIEVRQRFDEIVAFSGLEDFLDLPVKFYSSGMFVRLGFAVAVSAQPDLLLVDEVLAVGDVAFRMRCLERMHQLAEQGTTILVVTHSLTGLRSLCPRTVLLDAGRVDYDGPTDQAVEHYLQLVALAGERTLPTNAGVGPGVRLGQVGTATSSVASGDELCVSVPLTGPTSDPDLRLWVAVFSGAGVPVYSEALVLPDGLRADDGQLQLQLRTPLAPGSYDLHLGIRRLGVPWGPGAAPLSFTVTGGSACGGVADLAAQVWCSATDPS